MLTGLDYISSAPVEAKELPQYLKSNTVLIPLPFVHGIVERATLLGRVCEIFENIFNYFNSKWTRGWWQTFFDRAARSDKLKNSDAKYYLYKEAHVEELDSNDTRLKVVPKAFNALCPTKDVDTVKQNYTQSLFKTGTPLKTKTTLDTSLFRSLFNLTTHINGQTLLSMFSYSLDCLKGLVPKCQELLDAFSKRVAVASSYEKSVVGIIAQGRKPKLRTEAENHIIKLAKDLQNDAVNLSNKETMLFKGGCGSNNQQMRKRIREAFVHLQTQSIEKKLDTLDLSKVAKEGHKALENKFSSESSWDNDEVARFLTENFFKKHLKSFEETFRLSYSDLISHQTIAEKRKTHQVIKGWSSGDATKLKSYLKDLILNQRERSYGHLLSDGVFERYFDECGENVISAVKKGCDYLSDEWQTGLSTFLEKGSLDGIPDHMRDWLPDKISNEFAKTVHQGLRKMLSDDIFPSEISNGFFDTLFDSLGDQTKLEDAFRSAFSEFMQTRLVDNGFGKYNTDFTALLNQMPVEVRASFGQMGIDAPDIPIWYAFNKKPDRTYILKVFNATEDIVDVTEYAINDIELLSEDFFRQLIEFRVRPRIDEGISYALDDVHKYLKQHLNQAGTAKAPYDTQTTSDFQKFTGSQNIIFAVMKDQLGWDVKGQLMFAIRRQALVDMGVHCKKNTDDHTYLLEGAESFAKEAKERYKSQLGDTKELQEAFETFWDVSSSAPKEKTNSASTSVWINDDAKQKILTLAASLGISVEHVKLMRRIIQSGFGKDMGPVFDSLIGELLGNPHHLSKIKDDDMVDVGAKIGGIDSIYTAHSILSAYVRNRIQKTESLCLKLALQAARLGLWMLKILLATVLPITVKITPQIIKDLVYQLFMVFLNATLPILAKALVWIFLKKDKVEALRKSAFEYERKYMRKGGFDFKLEKNEEHHLQLFHWFRNKNDIKVVKTNNDKTAITQFEFKSLNLVFDVKDGKAYVNESKRAPNKDKKFDGYFIAPDQCLPKGMSSFAKYLVLENAEGEKRVILAEDSLDATIGSNLMRAITRQTSSPYLTRLFQGWSDQIFPSHRNETAYFVFNYASHDGTLESYNPSAMAYLLFYSITQGEIKQAEDILKRLTVLAERESGLPKTLEPLLRRIHVFCMLQSDRRTLFLGLKLAALREQYKLEGKESKRDRLAPDDDENAWKWLDALGLQSTLQRYMGMKHRMLEFPLNEVEEYYALKGLQRRLNNLREEFVDHHVEAKTLGELAALSAPDWVGSLASWAWSFAPQWMHNKKQNIEDKAQELYQQHKSTLSHQLMAPSLQMRLAELEKVKFKPRDSIKTRAAFSWLPHFIAKGFADPYAKKPILCDLPFEEKDMPFTFLADVDEAYGLNQLKTLRHLIAKPIGNARDPISEKLNVNDLSVQNLENDFFSYYRLACKTGGTDQQINDFHITLDKCSNRNPLFNLLQHVAKYPDAFPTAGALSNALLVEILNLDPLPKQSLDPIPDTFTPKMLTKEHLQQHFYAYYALAHCEVQGEIANKRRIAFKKALAKVNRIDSTTLLLKDVSTRNRRHFPTVNALKYALGLKGPTFTELTTKMRTNIIQHKKQSVPCTALLMTPKMLSTHFLDYYRLAMDPSQKDFHKELNKIVGHFDPMTTFLLTALKIVSSEKGPYPSIKAMEQAFILASNDDFKELTIQLKALKAACQTPYQNRKFQELTASLPPITTGTIKALKVSSGRMTPETIKQNYRAAYRLAKGQGDPDAVKAFHMQIGCLVDVSSDPKVNFLVIALSLISQNPSKYPGVKDQNTLITRVKQDLKAADCLDITRNLPASLLDDPTAQKMSNSANGWFGFGKIPGIITGALGLIKDVCFQNYPAIGKKAIQHGGSIASLVFKTPIPLNSLLFAAQTLSEDSAEPAPQLHVPQEKTFKQKQFSHDECIVEEVKKIDHAMYKDMWSLLDAHTEIMQDSKYGFSSEEDYFKVRKGLQNRKKHLSEFTETEMEKILSYANFTPIDFTQDFSERATPVTQDELMRIFITGDQEKLQRRTGLTDTQTKKLITMLLTYHQLCTQRAFLNEWEGKLKGIPIESFRFVFDDCTISRPFNWNAITVEGLRRHLLGASIENKRSMIKTNKASQRQIKAMQKLYPDLAARQWKKGAFTRRLMVRAG